MSARPARRPARWLIVGASSLAVAGTAAVLVRARGTAPTSSEARTDSAAPGTDDVRAAYELALKARTQGNYHDAREGFLRVLRLDPTFADARYQLATLTYSRGAVLETKHHVEAFEQSFPADPRVPALEAMLATPPPRHALTLGP